MKMAPEVVRGALGLCQSVCALIGSHVSSSAELRRWLCLALLSREDVCGEELHPRVSVPKGV